ncbi:hypothetical protein CBW65_06095 [Tumebacillus avium]|uniref:CN hydrolase domain-containing protein n=1 Tax=Tumebacillus avium TaxID=1903704 RepID=A0A1Y0IMW6_9BACL|nr:carbon-nitrogen hydrolase family protein [Tumebacillus avium]ARU60703.1 hypothetical protein CBW65_06095 [Tumebacillus avium]
MKLGLVQATFPASRQDAVESAKKWIRAAGERGCAVVCFPEAFVPGLRGVGRHVDPVDQEAQAAALEEVRQAAADAKTAVVLSMEWDGQLVGMVIDAAGQVLGYQAKNQIAPSEEPYYRPDGKRQVFTVQDVPVGIATCHEAWRYPETVRWAAVRGAKVVFHPQYTDTAEAGDMAAFYEGAMVCRSMENTIYFASVNYALEDQAASSTSLIAPDGTRIAALPLGAEGLLVAEIHPEQASGFLAQRYNPALYENKGDE